MYLGLQCVIISRPTVRLYKKKRKEKKMQQISESERVLMKIIWKKGGKALYSEIMEELKNEQSEWKKNTVLTLLSRLVEKKYLKVKKFGRRNEYKALIMETEYQMIQTHSFVDKIYGGSVKSLVSTLLPQNVLSKEELNEIECFWKEKKAQSLDGIKDE